MVNLVPVLETHREATGMVPLIIGYGNPYRQDDGFGWRVIDELKQIQTTFNFIREQQLAPELAEDISQASYVIFLDAAATGEPGTLRWEELTPYEAPGPHYTHHIAPQDLLALAHTLYGRAPDARLITVSGEGFELKDGLSDTVAARLPEVVELIEAMLIAGHISRP